MTSRSLFLHNCYVISLINDQLNREEILTSGFSLKERIMIFILWIRLPLSPIIFTNEKNCNISTQVPFNKCLKNEKDILILFMWKLLLTVCKIFQNRLSEHSKILNGIYLELRLLKNYVSMIIWKSNPMESQTGWKCNM